MSCSSLYDIDECNYGGMKQGVFVCSPGERHPVLPPTVSVRCQICDTDLVLPDGISVHIHHLENHTYSPLHMERAMARGVAPTSSFMAIPTGVITSSSTDQWSVPVTVQSALGQPLSSDEWNAVVNARKRKRPLIPAVEEHRENEPSPSLFSPPLASVSVMKKDNDKRRRVELDDANTSSIVASNGNDTITGSLPSALPTTSSTLSMSSVGSLTSVSLVTPSSTTTTSNGHGNTSKSNKSALLAQRMRELGQTTFSVPSPTSTTPSIDTTSTIMVGGVALNLPVCVGTLHSHA
jgi:hypothetical protein